MANKGWKWVIRLIGLVIFYLILKSINIPQTLQILFNANLILIILGLLMVFPQILMRAWRWHLLMRIQKIEYHWNDAVIVYFSGLFVGTFTPGRLGDFIKVLYLREEGYSFGKSFLSVFLDRCYDLAILIGIGYLSILYFIQRFSQWTFIFSTILVIVPLVCVLLYVSGIITKHQIVDLLTVLSPKRYRDPISKTLTDFFSDLPLFKIRPLTNAFFMTLGSWLFYYIMAYLFAMALALPISFLYLAGCVSIAAFITLLPVSISGIGTRDVAFIILFGYIGISSESAIAYSALILLMYAINGLIGFIAWQKKPLRNPVELNNC